MVKPSRQHLMIALAVAALPWAFFALTYLAAPGYVPSLASRTGQLIVLSMLVWDGIGLYIMLASKSVLAWALAFIFFVFPLMPAIMLGPAILTIINALGPLGSGR